MSERDKPNTTLILWKSYFAEIGSKLACASFSIFTFLCGLLGVLTSVFLLVMCTVEQFHDHSLSLPGFVTAFLFAGIVLGGLSSLLMFYGISFIKEATEMNTVEPPTYKNLLARLPPEEVLVRAASEPAEDAGKYLLRSTLTNSDMRAEELLIPTSKRQKSAAPTGET